MNEIGSTQPIDTNKNRPPFIVVYNYMGIICEKQDKVEEAIKYYKKALEEKASSLDLATVHNNLGRLYSILDSYNEAQNI
jgi:tetratricopeptide (TPR) repeat protein